MPLRRAVVSLLALAARAAGARGPAARGAATCYAKRYPDLKRKFCNADGACNLRQAKAHFREHGRREGRRFGCDDETNGTAPARVVDGIDEALWCARHATLPRGGLTQRGSFNDPPYAIDARRLHQTRPWLVSFSISGPFGPRRWRRVDGVNHAGLSGGTLRLRRVLPKRVARGLGAARDARSM